MIHSIPRLFAATSLVLAAHCLAEEPQTAVEKLADEARQSIVQVTFSGRDGLQLGLGSGFIISEEGLIATNLHVIGEARPISVELADKRKFKVTEVRASDRALDLALINIDAKELPALELGESNKVEDGQPIVVMGNPHGLKHSVVSGVVSGHREIDGRKMIQIAMPIERGNSGGPVLDAKGRVIGIVTMKSLITKNLGFAVQVDALKTLIAKPNPIPISRWLTIGGLNPKDWTPMMGATWRQRSGRIVASGVGNDPIGRRSICVSHKKLPEFPSELGVAVKLDDEAGAAGLIFHSDGDQKHYGFYPSNGRLRLSRFDGPSVLQWNVLAEVDSDDYRPGEWNHLKVRFEKDKFLCYVNDELVIESPDRVLPAGKVGLAKFRETVAEFKQFQVAKQIPATQIPPADRQASQKLVEKLPPLEAVKPDDLAPLNERATASRAVLREQAEQLEQRAAELRKIANDVHVRSVTDALAKLMKQDEEKIDMIQAALLIAKLDDEELQTDIYLEIVDRMVAEIKTKTMKDDDEAAKLVALNKYLFAENGFHGGRTNYYHRANSYLNQVLDDREGLPITLSVLHMELGRRIDLKIEGVGLPGHFVVKHVPKKGDEQLVDPFEGGKLLSRDDADQIVRAFAGRPLVDEDLRAATKKQIVLRMLRNLMGIAESDADKEAMLRYVEAAIAVEPEVVQERGMRALLRIDTGRRDAAISDLDWFIENKPPGIDLDQIRAMRAAFLKR